MQLLPEATKRRTNARNWPAVRVSSEEVGSSRMTRSSGASVIGEGARHLHHLAPADRQVLDDVGRRDVVAGEDFVQLGGNEIAGLAPPAKATQ